MRTIALLLALILAASTVSCAYRARTLTTAELTMAYDPGLRVYIVESAPGVYFHSGVYYRQSGSHWERSPKAQGPWRPCKKHHLPPGLRKKL